MEVKDVMDTTVILVRGSDTFGHLINVLDKAKYHVVFVVDKNDKLVGILTEGDIVKVLIPRYINVDESLMLIMNKSYFEKKSKECKDLRIDKIMTRSPLSLKEDDTIIKAAAMMVINKIHALPVVRDGKVVGIVPRLTLIKQITKIIS